MIPQLPRTRLKDTCHTKNQATLNLSEEGQSTDTNSVTTKMLELSDKDYKSSIHKKASVSDGEHC